MNDLRQRNNITERDYTPLPDVSKIREDAATTNVRSILDLSNAYHQIRIEPGYEIYNTINAGDLGSFQIQVMLQGDSNAPATMMRVMNTILAEYLGKFVWVYLDDIVVYSDTVQQHMEHLHLIFNKLYYRVKS